MSDDQQSMDLFGNMHPYNEKFKVFTKLPEKGLDEGELLTNWPICRRTKIKNGRTGSAPGPCTTVACNIMPS